VRVPPPPWAARFRVPGSGLRVPDRPRSNSELGYPRQRATQNSEVRTRNSEPKAPGMNQLIFWCSALFILYTYAGYPLLLWIWRRLARPRLPIQGSETPYVSILVTVRNEAGQIRQKIEDLLAIDYPADRFEILVASDASTDGTQAI